MPTKLRLTKSRQEQVATRKPARLRGEPLNYPIPLQEKYANELAALTKQMTAQTQREILRLFKAGYIKEYFAEDASPAAQARILTDKLAKKFNDLFSRRALDLAARMVNSADKASASASHASLKKLSGGLSIKTSIATSDVKQVLAASIAENVALIKSIAAKYQSDIQGAVMRSISNGTGLQTLVPALERQEGITIRRARNIALDQTRKAFSNINEARMRKAGVKKYEWLHSGGGQHPRELHISYSGQIFAFDDPPVIDENTGERGNPAQAPNCKCVAIPVIDFGEDEE